MDHLKYLEEHPFTYEDERMEVQMGICLTCSAMQSPHVLVYAQIVGDDGPPERLEYDTVEHALVGLLRAATSLVQNGHASGWDFTYSVAAWRMQLPGMVVELPQPPRAN